MSSNSMVTIINAMCLLRSIPTNYVSILAVAKLIEMCHMKSNIHLCTPAFSITELLFDAYRTGTGNYEDRLRLVTAVKFLIAN